MFILLARSSAPALYLVDTLCFVRCGDWVHSHSEFISRAFIFVSACLSLLTQACFESELYVGSDGGKTRLICIPSFLETK